MAFLCLIERLNKANIIATNKEILAYLVITIDGLGVTKMIKRLNEKFPKLLKVSFDTKMNHLSKIVASDYDSHSRARNTILTRPLHIKGEQYINVPSFVVSKRSCFLSSKELLVLAYLKSMPQSKFSGLLSVIAKK